MAVPFKIVVDCADPHRLAAFWAVALDYLPEDHSALIQRLLDAGMITDADTRTVDGRVLFQAVPEAKTVKNRVHLDLHVGEERRPAVVERLVELGGTVLWEGREGPSTWVTMADPE